MVWIPWIFIQYNMWNWFSSQKKDQNYMENIDTYSMYSFSLSQNVKTATRNPDRWLMLILFLYVPFLKEIAHHIHYGKKHWLTREMLLYGWPMQSQHTSLMHHHMLPLETMASSIHRIRSDFSWNHDLMNMRNNDFSAWEKVFTVCMTLDTWHPLPIIVQFDIPWCRLFLHFNWEYAYHYHFIIYINSHVLTTC